MNHCNSVNHKVIQWDLKPNLCMNKIRFIEAKLKKIEHILRNYATF